MEYIHSERDSACHGREALLRIRITTMCIEILSKSPVQERLNGLSYPLRFCYLVTVVLKANDRT